MPQKLQAFPGNPWKFSTNGVEIPGKLSPKGVSAAKCIFVWMCPANPSRVPRCRVFCICPLKTDTKLEFRSQIKSAHPCHRMTTIGNIGRVTKVSFASEPSLPLLLLLPIPFLLLPIPFLLLPIPSTCFHWSIFGSKSNYTAAQMLCNHPNVCKWHFCHQYRHSWAAIVHMQGAIRNCQGQSNINWPLSVALLEWSALWECTPESPMVSESNSESFRVFRSSHWEVSNQYKLFWLWSLFTWGRFSFKRFFAFPAYISLQEKEVNRRKVTWVKRSSLLAKS